MRVRHVQLLFGPHLHFKRDLTHSGRSWVLPLSPLTGHSAVIKKLLAYTTDPAKPISPAQATNHHKKS